MKKLTNEYRGKLMLLSHFNALVGITDENAPVILKPLILSRKVTVSKIDEDFVIKVPKDEKSSGISEVDVGVFQLEKNELMLQEVVEALEKEAEAAMDKVRSCLKNNRKQMVRFDIFF